jgi:hypothetical protein
MDSIFTVKDFDGIDIDNCLSAHFYSLKKVRSEGGLRDRFSLAFNDLVRSTYSFHSIGKEKNSDFLCFRGLVRDDYDYFFNQIICNIKNMSVIKVENFKIRNSRINLEVSKFVSNNVHLMALIKEPNPIRKACFYLHFCSILLVLQELKKIDFKVLLVFADMQPHDNLLVEFFKKRGKKTVTLQHGLYVEYDNYDTVNKINYERQCADYFLAWGECTGKLIKKHHPLTKVVICGKPELSVAHRPIEKLEEKIPYILVILDQPIFDDFNFAMIKITAEYAKNKGLRLKIKFHPQNDRQKYAKHFGGLDESSDLRGSQLLIGHTSSLLYEALVLGLKVLRYKTEIPCINLTENHEFCDSHELALKAKNVDISEEQASYFIAYTGIESERKYESFFKSLI